jgi:hypothetical protein
MIVLLLRAFSLLESFVSFDTDAKFRHELIQSSGQIINLIELPMAWLEYE